MVGNKINGVLISKKRKPTRVKGYNKMRNRSGVHDSLDSKFGKTKKKIDKFGFIR